MTGINTIVFGAILLATVSGFVVGWWFRGMIEKLRLLRRKK